MVFDDFLGWMVLESKLPPARTAYLTTQFRSVTPIGRELRLCGRITRTEGRKRFVTGELWDGERLCAEADGLWVELKPGQQ